MTYDTLLAYLRDCERATDAVLVTGHPAPDTDAVVSALFEAWRLTRAGTPAVPVVQGAVPRETAWLLGDLALPVAAASAPARWVLTDHHDVARYAGAVVAIVDHHPVVDAAEIDGIDACIRPVGAATTLVAQRIRADGILPDAACARILLGAVMMDTEGLSPHKARAEDRETVAWLSALCGEDPVALYAALRDRLLSETDPTVLYERDYRVYTAADGTPVMGFAILKVKRENLPDLTAVRRRLAADAAAVGYAATVAKIVLYAPDDSREEIYLAAGPSADAVLAQVLADSGLSARRTAEDAVFLPADCHHWGRKRYAAKLLEILSKKG